MINADADTVWRLVTTAATYPKWRPARDRPVRNVRTCRRSGDRVLGQLLDAGVRRENVRKLVAVNTGRVLDG
jgi:uncharacterized protein YndB with AHSA1/START domain